MFLTGGSFSLTLEDILLKLDIAAKLNSDKQPII